MACVEGLDDVKPNICQRFKALCLRHFLPIGIVISTVFGIFLPQPAAYLNEKIPLFTICVVCLFTTIGLRLRVSEAKSAIKSYKEIVIGMILIIFLTPFCTSSILNEIPYFSSFIDEQTNSKNASNISIYESKIFGPEEFRLGLQIYFMSPSAPLCALLLVTAANADRGLSILLSILLVFLSIFTFSSTLTWFSASLNDVNISIGHMLLNNFLKIFLPVMVSRLIRSVPQANKVIKTWDDPIKYCGIMSLFVLLLVRISVTSEAGHLSKISTMNVVLVILLGNVLLSFTLLCTYGFFSLLPWFSRKSTITLTILNCIRTVGMAASVADALPEHVGDKGLIILPMGFICLTNLFILNGFVNVVKMDDEEEEKAPEVKQEVTGISNMAEESVFSIYSDQVIVDCEKYLRNQNPSFSIENCYIQDRMTY